LQHPFADRHDEPAFFGQRDEAGWRNSAHHAAEPAQQGFHADDAAAREVDLRLVVEREFPLFEGPAQAVFQVQALEGVHVHDFVEEAVGVSAAFLGVVHGGVGVFHQHLDAGAVFRVEGDADRERCAQLLVVDFEGRFELDEDFFGHPRGVVGAVHAGEHDQEFIAALAADRVGVADTAREPQRNALQQLVAHQVAERVVDCLEAVQIEEQQRDAVALAGGVGEGLLQAVVEKRPVGQAGQRVVMGQEGDARLGGLAFGDIGKNRHVMGQASALVAHGADRQGRGVEGAVFPPVAHFALPEAEDLDVPPHGLVEILVVGAGAEQAGRLSDGLCFGVAGDLGEGPVDRQDAFVGVSDDDGFDAVAENGPCQLQLLFVAAPDGDVGNRRDHAANGAGFVLEEGNRVGPYPASGAVPAIHAEHAGGRFAGFERLYGGNLAALDRLAVLVEVEDEVAQQVQFAHFGVGEAEDFGGRRVV
jgi:hypothetical protein